MMKQFCFIIPAYNNKVLLRNTLEALNNQKGFTTEDYEVVVAEDGSDEPVFDYIRDINKNYCLKYIYLPREKSSCRSRIRNAGAKIAEAKYLIFLDADILVREDYLAELKRCFSIDENVSVIGTRLMLPSIVPYESVLDKSVFEKCSFDRVDHNYYEDRHFLFNIVSYNPNSRIDPWMMFYSCNIVVPKQQFDKVGGFDENYKGWGMEDIDLGCSLTNEGFKIVISSKLEGLHQFHGQSDRGTIPIGKKEEYRKNIDYFLEKFPEGYGMPREILYKLLFFEIGYIPRVNTESFEKILIKFFDKEKLEHIKSVILQLCVREGLDIVVEDYVESTDLDIWIQLLDFKIAPKYYPASRLKSDLEIV